MHTNEEQCKMVYEPQFLFTGGQINNVGNI